MSFSVASEHAHPQGPRSKIIIERLSTRIEPLTAAKNSFLLIVCTTKIEERYQVNIGEHLIRMIRKT